jgi:cell division protein FtsZ
MDIEVYEEFERPKQRETVIMAVGVGGAGSNVVNRMLEWDLGGIIFIAANTDLQALNENKAKIKLPIGSKLTSGLGAGGKPEVGEKAAQEDRDLIAKTLKGANMVFVTAGMGGGTGTGAAPVIAQVARECGALTVGVVSKPFDFEGRFKMRLAEEGIAKMREAVDTLIVIQNQKLLSLVEKRTPIKEAFRKVDDILRHGIQGISDLILKVGLINIDFADVESTMGGQGDALMGIGLATGDNRAKEAALQAIENPLLEGTTIEGARRLLINVSGGENLALAELEEVVSVISEKADPDVETISGAVQNNELGEKLQVTVIATGFQKKPIAIGVSSGNVSSGDAPAQERDVVGFEEWGTFTNRSARTRPDYLALRNYQQDDLDVPTVMRFPQETGKEEK